MDDELWIKQMKSPKAGGHGVPGSRCRCTPLAGILTDQPWGIYGSKFNIKDEREQELIDLIKMCIDEAESKPEYSTIYHNTAKQIVKEFPQLEEISSTNFKTGNLISEEHALAIIKIWEEDEGLISPEKKIEKDEYIQEIKE